MTVVDVTCVACRAKIRWATVEPSGKRIPLEAYPEPDGNLYVVKTHPLTVRVVRHRDTIPPGATRYNAHFTTCPDRVRAARPKPPTQQPLFGLDDHRAVPEHHNPRRTPRPGETGPPIGWDEWQRQRAEAETAGD